jgi:hypothetical protein
MVGCSKTFRALLIHLTTRNDDSDLTNAQQRQIEAAEANRACLESLVVCIGDENLKHHLQLFLNSYSVRSNNGRL